MEAPPFETQPFSAAYLSLSRHKLASRGRRRNTSSCILRDPHDKKAPLTRARTRGPDGNMVNVDCPASRYKSRSSAGSIGKMAKWAYDGLRNIAMGKSWSSSSSGSGSEEADESRDERSRRGRSNVKVDPEVKAQLKNWKWPAPSLSPLRTKFEYVDGVDPLDQLHNDIDEEGEEQLDERMRFLAMGLDYHFPMI